MMTRDNEAILAIATQLGRDVRQAVQDLMQAGAPADMVIQVLHLLNELEHTANRLSEDRPASYLGTTLDEAAIAAAERVTERLERALDGFADQLRENLRPS